MLIIHKLVDENNNFNNIKNKLEKTVYLILNVYHFVTRLTSFNGTLNGRIFVPLITVP